MRTSLKSSASGRPGGGNASGPAWGLMLALLAAAILAAALIAYRMIYPFFHRAAHARPAGKAALYFEGAFAERWARAASSTGMPSSTG